MWWHEGSNWWWVLPLVAFVILGALMAFVVALGRTPPPWTEGDADPAVHAERILDERYARGELDDEEFQHRLAVLRGAESPKSAPARRAGW